MLMSQPLPFVKTFVEAIDEAIRAHHSLSPGLSTIQRSWLGLCLMGVLVTNSVCWARFERASLGRHSLAASSWMFRHARLPWALLLQKRVQGVLSQHGITGGSLVVDDADKARSKSTHRLACVRKLKDKTSGGCLMGQTLVFLLLVTERITVPVGFAFYVPDPAPSAWRQQDRALKKQGIPKCQRPAKPPRNEAYPTKQALALQLLARFRHHHPTLPLEAVLAGAARMARRTSWTRPRPCWGVCRSSVSRAVTRPCAFASARSRCNGISSATPASPTRSGFGAVETSTPRSVAPDSMSVLTARNAS